MALLVFVWTPVHFWALALLKNPVRQTALPLFGYRNIYLALVIAVVMLSLLWR